MSFQVAGFFMTANNTAVRAFFLASILEVCADGEYGRGLAL
jgi:hypothetical protein